MNGAVAIDMFLSLGALVRYWVALIAANLINLFCFSGGAHSGPPSCFVILMCTYCDPHICWGSLLKFRQLTVVAPISHGINFFLEAVMLAVPYN
jgi:hypothetical protein